MASKSKPSVGQKVGDPELVPDLALSDLLLQRPSGLGSWHHLVRIGLAVTASWLVAEPLSQSQFTLFAPITTLMVVQGSPWSTLSLSTQRILGTGTGVLMASLWVNLVGTTWWSFLVAVMVALAVARLLPWSLTGQLQIPLAVVFVLAMGAGSIQQDLWRVLDVIIGGAVGLAAVYIYPPRPRRGPLDQAMQDYRDSMIDVLEAVGAGSGNLQAPLAADELHDYVQASRALRAKADSARSALAGLVDSTTINPRASSARAGLGRDAVQLRRLSAIGLQIRGVTGAANALYDRDFRPWLDPASFQDLLRDLTELARQCLGAPGAPLHCADVDRALGTAQALAVRINDLAEGLAAEHAKSSAVQVQEGGALASIGMLARLDYIRAQLVTLASLDARSASNAGTSSVEREEA